MGELSADNMGRVWRFNAGELDEWMKQGQVVEASTGKNEDGKETQTS